MIIDSDLLPRQVRAIIRIMRALDRRDLVDPAVAAWALGGADAWVPIALEAIAARPEGVDTALYGDIRSVMNDLRWNDEISHLTLTATLGAISVSKALR